MQKSAVMNSFIILPDQLFYCKKALEILALNDVIYIIEEPHYFDAYKYHKSKIILHRASMQYYYLFLKKHFKHSNMQKIALPIETTSDLNNHSLKKFPKIIYVSLLQLKNNEFNKCHNRPK